MYLNDCKVTDSNGFIYSIDMLRLTTKISPLIFQKKINSRLEFYKAQIEKWINDKKACFYYNFSYSNDNNSFWIGYMHNQERNGLSNEKKEYTLTIDFNPNKLKNNPLLLSLLNVKEYSFWSVKSLDLAVDVPTNILNLSGFNKGRKRCLMTYDMGGDNKTYYIGKAPNRIKIYNKKIENNLDYDLTRIEMSKEINLDILDLKDYQFNFDVPKLFINEYQLDFQDLQNAKSTLNAILYAVNNGFPVHDLPRVYKEKVLDRLQQKKPIDIDLNCFKKSLNGCLKYYFKNLLI